VQAIFFLFLYKLSRIYLRLESDICVVSVFIASWFCISNMRRACSDAGWAEGHPRRPRDVFASRFVADESLDLIVFIVTNVINSRHSAYCVASASWQRNSSMLLHLDCGSLRSSAILSSARAHPSPSFSSATLLSSPASEAVFVFVEIKTAKNLQIENSVILFYSVSYWWWSIAPVDPWASIGCQSYNRFVSK